MISNDFSTRIWDLKLSLLFCFLPVDSYNIIIIFYIRIPIYRRVHFFFFSTRNRNAVTRVFRGYQRSSVSTVQCCQLTRLYRETPSGCGNFATNVQAFDIFMDELRTDIFCPGLLRYGYPCPPQLFDKFFDCHYQNIKRNRRFVEYLKFTFYPNP